MDSVIRGDTAIWTLPFLDKNEAPLNLSGYTIWVTVKQTTGTPDSMALYQHYLVVNEDGSTGASRGMTLGEGGAAAGIVEQELTPAESRLFKAGGYVYDVQVRMPSGRIYTLVRGATEVVEDDVTQAITPPSR